MVHYRSTRGGMRDLTFEQAVLTGLASDRGLLVPEDGQFPQLPANALHDWAKLSYQDLAVQVMRLFVDESEISTPELKTLVHKSYNAQTFRAEETTPVVKITDQLLVLELFHGPTFAFKDIALQFLGNLFEFFLKRKNANKAEDAPTHKITVVGATSGDTGSSAIYGLRGKENIEVFITFPHGRVSAIQERQMTTVLDENIHNVAVEGTFDDCQAIVKDLFADAPFKAQYNLGAVNSINWARILAQIVYYVYAYFRAKEQGVENVSFSVPTGNFGDILAGFYAKKLGVPLGKLVVATNENDILHRFFSTGKYHRYKIEHTISPSMDICVSSNFERYLFALCGEDSKVLSQWMHDFESTGKLTISGELLEKAQEEMASYAVLQDEVQAIISRYQKVHQYLFDPHTAIGTGAAEHFGEAYLADSPKSAVVVVGTAHYGKFLPVVSKALGVAEHEVEQHPILKALEKLPTRLLVTKNSSAAVAQLVRSTMKKRSAPSSSASSSSLWQKLVRSENKCLTASAVVVAASAVAFFVVKRSLASK
uniref:Threonine synthase n=1 Tax=Globisporangium ultimum (strain ATCC 200006 / CBS 805.95 / DAOM BR144) TaxID=431595 RepID=K3X440_GLOUD